VVADRPLGYTTQTSVVSSAPPEVVFETIANLQNHLDWSDNGTFHDSSVVTEATRPHTFVIETDAHLDRKRGRPWDPHFIHRYDVAPEGEGSRITYTETVARVNYVPYWLHPLVRPIFKVYVNRADRKQLANLARLAEERASSPSS
jgi:hypothetical protein